MLRSRSCGVVLFIAVAISAVGLGATFEESWNDLLHYAAIGRLDLAKGHAQASLAKPIPGAIRFL